MSTQHAAPGEPRGGGPGRAGGSPDFDVTKPHPARIYDYWLGGKDNFAADREAAERVIATQPSILATVRANRAFLRRAVTFLVQQAGIRQFLDLGTGLPAADNTHEVAQRIAPDTRVVYADNDPIVLAHARALLTSAPQGATAYLLADARDTATIVREAAQTLDFGQPIAVMMLGLLHYIADTDRPDQIVRQIMATVPPGSYLAVSAATADIDTRSITESAAQFNRQPVAAPFIPRPRDQIARYFDGLELADPGLVPLAEWRTVANRHNPVPAYAGVARKP